MEKSPKSSQGGELKRRSVRTRDANSLYATIDDTPALVFSVSRTGCGLIMIPETAPKEGEDVMVQLAGQKKVRGRVRWCKALDVDVTKVGIEYFN